MLDEARWPTPGLVHRPRERGDERDAIDRMDRIEQRHRLVGLVRLELPDQVKRDIGRRRAQRGPFRLRFLDAILAEHALAGVDQRPDRRNGVRLGNRDQRSEEHTSELQSLMSRSYAVFCLKKKKK